MTYRLSFCKDGAVHMVHLRAHSPEEAGSDVARYLRDGATRVEVEETDGLWYGETRESVDA